MNEEGDSFNSVNLKLSKTSTKKSYYSFKFWSKIALVDFFFFGEGGVNSMVWPDLSSTTAKH